MSDFEGSILKIPEEEVIPLRGQRRPLSRVLGTEVAGTGIAVCCGLTWQPATRTRQLLAQSSPCPVGWGGERTKSKTCGLR